MKYYSESQKFPRGLVPQPLAESYSTADSDAILLWNTHFVQPPLRPYSLAEQILFSSCPRIEAPRRPLGLSVLTYPRLDICYQFRVVY